MSRILHDRFVKVQNIVEETPQTKSFVLDLAGEPFQFLPGQFVNVTAQLPDERRVRRAYSIASSPLEPELLLTVKRMEDGLLSNYLCNMIKVGDLLHVRGPYGRFILPENAQEVVFIAAGSGIVPFRSMWRYIRQSGSKTTFSLLYSSKSFRSVIYSDELGALRKAGYHIVHTFTGADDSLSMGYTRRIDRYMLLEFVRDFGRKFFYTCGPPAFCDCVVRYLLELKVERERIKIEKYD
jgi:ferredoxin-NADP reductase